MHRYAVLLPLLVFSVPAPGTDEGIVFGVGDSPILQRSLVELVTGLRDLYGVEMVPAAASPAVTVLVGREAYSQHRERLGLPALAVAASSPEAFCIHFQTATAPRSITVIGNDEAGTNFGLLKATALLYDYWARDRGWPPTMTVQRAPLVPLRGMYTHNLYAHHHPWAPRRWTPDETQLYFELLTALGYNLHLFTPGIGVMQTPLTELGRQGLDYFMAQRDRARRTLGMRFWPGDAANDVTFQEEPVPIWERGLGKHEWVDPGDPKMLDAILDNREELFKHWPDLDGFWVIDGDPGGYPGSTAEEFAAILLGLRERLNRARPEGKNAAIVYWFWTTWSPELDENTGVPVLRMLKERMAEPWYVMVCADSGLEAARAAGVLDHALYYPYHLVEYEPHGPFTAPRFDQIPVETNRGIDGGARCGSVCNTMSPLIQLPNIAYFQACLWKPKTQQPEPATVMWELAAQTIPEHADVLAGAWIAIEHDPRSPLCVRAKENLDALLAQGDLGRLGPVGRRWFPNVRFHLECLSEMLGVHIKSGPARDAIRDLGFTSQVTEDAIVDYLRAYLVWIQKTGYGHPRRLLTGKGYDWLRFETINRRMNGFDTNADARALLLRAAERCADLWELGARVAVEQIGRHVVHFDEGEAGGIPPELRDGDVIVIDVGGELAEVVRGMTHSPYTHCGIVKTGTAGVQIVEGTDPSRVVPLDVFLKQAHGGYYTHLRPIDVPEERVAKAVEEALTFVGRPYDNLMQWDDERIYCSELVWKAYQRGAGVMLGQKCRIGELDWQPYEGFIRAQDPNGELPLDREVITPAAIVRSPQVRILYNSFPQFTGEPENNE